MAVRRRVTFRGDRRPWAATDRRPPAQVVDLEPGHPPEVSSRSTRSTARRAPTWSRRWRWPIAALLVAVVALASVVSRPSSSPPPDDAVPPTVDFEGRTPPGPVWIPTSEVVSPPYRGSVNRYWPADDERRIPRVGTWLLDDLSAWTTGPPRTRRALLVVDATRRAQVVGDGDRTVSSGIGPTVGLRRLEDTRLGLVTWEWDRPGWGFSLLTTGIEPELIDDLVTGLVRLPEDPSLQGDGFPTLDRTVLVAAGLDVRWSNRRASAIVGAPLIGQGGLDTAEGYLYAPGPEAPTGSVLVAATVERAVTAADVAALLGPDRWTPPQVASLPGPVVGIDYEVDSSVGFRVTGTSRLLVDGGEGVSFELVSDALDVHELLDVAGAIDFAQLARHLRTG